MTLVLTPEQLDVAADALTAYADKLDADGPGTAEAADESRCWRALAGDFRTEAEASRA